MALEGQKMAVSGICGLAKGFFERKNRAMPSEHQKFKQFLNRRRCLDSSSVKNNAQGINHPQQVYCAIKALKAKGATTKAAHSSAPEHKRRGRPTKADSEKVRSVCMKLSPQAIAELQHLPFGRGVGSRVRELLKYFKRQEAKELARVKMFRKLLIPFDAHLHSYLKLAKVAAQSAKAQTVLQKLADLADKIRVVVEIFQWDGEDFRAYLTRDEVLTVQFALEFKREIRERRSFAQIY